MPIYIMKVTDTKGDIWEEEYDLPHEQAAHDMIKSYNAFLRPGERSRTLLSITLKEDQNVKPEPKPHKWLKTNLYTVFKGNRYFDTYECEVCGITGKVFGTGPVIRDPSYKAKKYTWCQNEEDNLD